MVEPLPWRDGRRTQRVEGVLDVGGKDADGIERQADSRIAANGGNQQTDGAGDLADACQGNNRLGLRDPGWGDAEKRFGHGQVQDAREAVEARERQPAPDAPAFQAGRRRQDIIVRSRHGRPAAPLGNW